MPKNAGMSLTTQDLQAIQQLIDASEQRMRTYIDKAILASERRMRTYVDEAIDALARQTAAGFQEVHERLDRIEERLDRVEERLDRVEERLDRVEQRLDSMELAQAHERIRTEVHDEQISHITTTLRAV